MIFIFVTTEWYPSSLGIKITQAVSSALNLAKAETKPNFTRGEEGATGPKIAANSEKKVAGWG